MWADGRAYQRTLVSSTYKGIDDDVRQIFFNLDPTARQQVFRAYEEQHGKGARKYAESVCCKWQSGTVQMSGEVSERLVKLLPRFLSFEQKYGLITKLWAGYRQKTRVRVEVFPEIGVDAIIATVVEAVRKADEQVLPTAVLSRLQWLADHDALAARALMNEVLVREGYVIAGLIWDRLHSLLHLASEYSDKQVSGVQVVELPATTLEIIVRQVRRLAMSQNGEDRRQPSPTSAGPAGSQVPAAPIQNAKDLLSEAIKHVSPGKVEALMGTAAEEALRLQVMQKEGEVDNTVVEGKVDSLAGAVRNLSHNPNLAIRAETEHRSKHGYTRVTIESARPQSKRDCFVATTCYDDYDHPTVLVLRRFRDLTLMRTLVGRRFVAWYYRRGPALARALERVPVLKTPRATSPGYVRGSVLPPVSAGD